MKPTTVSISAWSVIRILLVLLGVWFLWFIRDVIAILFVSLLLAALIDPFASWFQKHKIPRGVGVVVVYLVLLTILTGVILLIVPPLVTQLTALGANLAVSFDSVTGLFDELLVSLDAYGLSDSLVQATSGLQETISKGLTSGVGAVAGFFGGIATLSLVLVMAFYIVVEEDSAKRLFRHFAPKKYQPYIVGLVGRAQQKLGAWLRGQIVLMIIVGILTYIGLVLAGVDYALVLAIFAGFAELVPYAGPIIAAIPAIIIAFIMSPVKAIIVAIMYYAIQQLENNVLTPKIMQKSVGLNPVVSLAVLLIGFEVAGLMGAILAIPVSTVASVVVKDLVAYYDKHQK